MKNASEKRPLNLIASDFFTYLGRHLPQQCAGDEFYFLPRSENAIQHLNTLDDLSPEIIQDHTRHVQDLLREVPLEEFKDLEEEIDRLILKQSMGGFIREYSDAEVWRTDPTLYIKIPLFATDQVISQRHGTPDRAKADLSTILAQIPAFLSRAIQNIRFPSEMSLQVALHMTQDAAHFFGRDIQAFIEAKMSGNKELVSKNIKVSKAWERFKTRLLELTPRPSFGVGEDGLRKILLVSLSYSRPLAEILEIAQQAYQDIQGKLHAAAMKIDSRRSWNELISENLPSISSAEEVLALFEREVHGLRRLLDSRDILSVPAGEQVVVLQTPAYLQSLRATASYRAPLTGGTPGRGVFYITPGTDDLGLVAGHCPYLSAHETYPGHHILDHLRIHQSNPIRRQIESPLFYEGWACYGELLIDELGHVRDPWQQLIGLKRQLWRCLRATLDIGLQTGKVSPVQAAKRIERLGFSSKRAQRQVRRFCLTPGYQLCYFMGMYEIMGLRKQFSSRMGLKKFHDILLGGGEIPFHLVEKRLKACLL